MYTGSLFRQSYKDEDGFSLFRWDVFLCKLLLTFVSSLLLGLCLYRTYRKAIFCEPSGGGGLTGSFHRLFRYVFLQLLPCLCWASLLADLSLGPFQATLVALTASSAFFVAGALQPFGLTGGIACGKSSVATRLSSSSSSSRRSRVGVVDLDKIAHSLYEPSTQGNVCKLVAKAFGAEVLRPDGGVDRKKLRETGIFNDATKRRALNAITHPRIRSKMLWEMFSMRCLSLFDFVVVDCPLLFESPVLRYCFSAVIVVHVSRSTQLSRLQRRNPDLGEQQCRDAIDCQMSLEVKKKLADVGLENEGTEEELREKVDEVVRKMERNRGLLALEHVLLVAFLTVYWMALGGSVNTRK